MSGRDPAGGVLIAAPEFRTGGVGSFVTDLAAGLLGRGRRVDLLATDGRGDLHGALAPRAAYHDLGGVPLSRRKVEAAARAVAATGATHLVLNHAPLVGYALPLLGGGVRAIAVVHSDDPRYYRAALRMRGRIARWVAPSEAVARRCAGLLPPALRGRVALVPHGVDAAFHARGRAGGAGAGGAARPGRIAFVGFLGPNKGADLVPAIVRGVGARHPDARFTLVGEGPLREPLGRELGAEIAAGRCRLAGRLGRGAVAEVLRASDVLLAPTRLEGFGLALAEAMACGAVPVATRLAGVTDGIVDDGRTGVLVPEDDVAGFAAAVAALLSDRGRLAALSQAAAADAAGRFSADRMLDAYEALFAAPGPDAPAPRRGAAGWAVETGLDLARSPLDAAWLARRVRGLLGGGRP